MKRFQKKTKHHSVRTIIRIITFIIAVVLALQVTPFNLAIIFPAMSPFLAICSAIAIRSTGLIFLLCLPVTVISLYKRRWFCSYMCPTGLLTEVAGRIRPNAKSKFIPFPRLGPWIIMITLGGALFGYPLFIWLDPLSIFSGFISVWYLPVTFMSLAPAIGLIFILLLSVWRPNIWCYRLCPLGFSQEILALSKRSIHKKQIKEKTSQNNDKTVISGILSRRMFLGTIAGGVIASLIRKAKATTSLTTIRPPGSVEEKDFTAICARCGNCIQSCPECIIEPDLGQTGISGILTPVISIGQGYCSEWCNECNKVCPTGAITHLSLDDKRAVSIGTAIIIKSKCLSWNKSQYCMVCDEYCPYHAIKLIKHNYVNCPEVDTDICRGCGLCQTVCPTLGGKAIIVQGQPQKKLKHVQFYGDA